MRFLVVATFAHPDHVGGAERVITDVAQRLAQGGHPTTLLVSDAGGLVPHERRDGVDVVRYPVDRSSPVRFWRSAFAGVRAALPPLARQADVLHVHQVLSALAALAPGSAARHLPSVLTFHAPYYLEYLARFREGRDEGPVPVRARVMAAALQRADRYVLAHSDRILVLSRFALGQVAALEPAAPARTAVAGAGVDLDRFRPAQDDAERQACAQSLGLPADETPLLVTVRRLVPRMGLPDLLEACRQLHDEGAGFRLAIAGDGEQRTQLERTANEAGLPVSFLGRLSDEQLVQLYRAASVFVLPTRALEGFGMATAEALATGLPVVATDAGATRDLLDGARGSMTVPAGDPAALARALTGLLGNANGLHDAGRAARAHAEHTLHWDTHVQAVVEAALRARELHR